jgi:hypothetical protein
MIFLSLYNEIHTNLNKYFHEVQSEDSHPFQRIKGFNIILKNYAIIEKTQSCKTFSCQNVAFTIRKGVHVRQMISLDFE